MKRNLKTSFILFFLSLIFITPSASALSQPRLWIHGAFVETDVPPMIQNNRTLVPLRVISENLGCEVNWDGQNRLVTVHKADQSKDTWLEFAIGKSEVTMIEKDPSDPSASPKTRAVQLDVAPKIYSNRTLVPLRFIAEIFDEDVTWDPNQRVAVVGEGYVSRPTKNYEARIQEARNRFNYLVNPNHRNIGYTELAYEYETWISEILSDQVDNLMNDPKFKEVYPSHDDYWDYYSADLQSYLGIMPDRYDFGVGANEPLCASDFAIYEIYRLDSIYNHRKFDYDKYTMAEDVDEAIRVNRIVFSSEFDSYFDLPMDIQALLGKKIITQDNSKIRKGPGREFDIIGSYRKGQIVDVVDIAYIDGEIWLSTSTSEWCFIELRDILNDF